jgi:hypothetical protein
MHAFLPIIITALTGYPELAECSNGFRQLRDHSAPKCPANTSFVGVPSRSGETFTAQQAPLNPKEFAPEQYSQQYTDYAYQARLLILCPRYSNVFAIVLSTPVDKMPMILEFVSRCDRYTTPHDHSEEPAANEETSNEIPACTTNP